LHSVGIIAKIVTNVFIRDPAKIDPSLNNSLRGMIGAVTTTASTYPNVNICPS